MRLEERSWRPQQMVKMMMEVVAKKEKVKKKGK